jgi:hypothetical protein
VTACQLVAVEADFLVVLDSEINVGNGGGKDSKQGGHKDSKQGGQ